MQNLGYSQNKIFKNGILTLDLYTLTVGLVYSIFFMPDYIGFGVINTQRICLLLIWGIILKSPERRKDFINAILNVKYNGLIVIYILILLVVTIIRFSPNTILNPFFDQIAIFYTVYYLFKSGFPVSKFIQILIKVVYILCFLGILEYFTKFNLFSQFQIIKGMISDSYIRGGTYRIFGPTHHPLGYGLFLILMLTIVCYKEKIGLSLMNRPFGVLLIVTNVFFTGSRSTLGIILLELVMITLLSTGRKKKEVFTFIGLFLGILISLIVIFFNTEIVQSILSRFSLVVDAGLGTNLASSFGIEGMATYQNSQKYRELLPRIFSLKYINPLIGQGYNYQFQWYVQGYFIQSIDHYYINQYLKVAYPGLIIQCLIYLVFLLKMLKTALFKHSQLSLALFISCVCYFINLFWMDTLGTLDYLFFLLGLAYYLSEQSIGERTIA